MLITDIRIICTFLFGICHMQVPLKFNFWVHISNLNKSSHTVKGYKRITSTRRLRIPRYSLSFIATPSTAGLPHRKFESVGTSRYSFRAEDSDKRGALYNPFCLTKPKLKLRILLTHSIPHDEAFRVSQQNSIICPLRPLKNTKIHKSTDTPPNAVLKPLRTRLAASGELTDQPAVTCLDTLGPVSLIPNERQ